DVIELNSTTKPWVITDYINKYYIDGNKEYGKLLLLLEEYRMIPPTSLISLAMGYKKYSSLAPELTRRGLFKFYNYPELIVFLKQYKSFCEYVSINSIQYTFFSYLELYISKEFSEKQLVDGIIKKGKYEIDGISHQGVVLEFFIKAHNFGEKVNSSKAIKYKIKNDGSPVITSPQSFFIIKEADNG
ncbi:chromosome partitioning protein ParB, partial [Enterococcus faecalis]|nr:chromosome partitioning protein ParB [Enterococcus faecalis]